MNSGPVAGSTNQHWLTAEFSVVLNHEFLEYWVSQKSYKFVKQGGHKSGKHGKPGKLKEFEKWSKFQGKLREI